MDVHHPPAGEPQQLRLEDVPVGDDDAHVGRELAQPAEEGRVRRPLGLEHGNPFGLCLDLRSEEHTSELQSQSNLVCRLLLEKKKKWDHRGRTTYISRDLRTYS